MSYNHDQYCGPACHTETPNNVPWAWVNADFWYNTYGGGGTNGLYQTNIAIAHEVFEMMADPLPDGAYGNYSNNSCAFIGQGNGTCHYEWEVSDEVNNAYYWSYSSSLGQYVQSSDFVYSSYYYGATGPYDEAGVASYQEQILTNYGWSEWWLPAGNTNWNWRCAGYC